MECTYPHNTYKFDGVSVNIHIFEYFALCWHWQIAFVKYNLAGSAAEALLVDEVKPLPSARSGSLERTAETLIDMQFAGVSGNNISLATLWSGLLDDVVVVTTLRFGDLDATSTSVTASHSNYAHRREELLRQDGVLGGILHDWTANSIEAELSTNPSELALQVFLVCIIRG